MTPHRELEAELVEAFREALRAAAFVGGAQVDAFEREFAAYCGTSTALVSPTEPMPFDSR